MVHTPGAGYSKYNQWRPGLFSDTLDETARDGNHEGQVHHVSWIWWLRKSVFVAFIESVHSNASSRELGLEPASEHSTRHVPDTSLTQVHQWQLSAIPHPEQTSELPVLLNRAFSAQVTCQSAAGTREAESQFRSHQDVLFPDTPEISAWLTQWITILLQQCCTVQPELELCSWKGTVQPMFKSKKHGRPWRVHQLWVTTITWFLFAVEHPGANV